MGDEMSSGTHKTNYSVRWLDLGYAKSVPSHLLFISKVDNILYVVCNFHEVRDGCVDMVYAIVHVHGKNIDKG